MRERQSRRGRTACLRILSAAVLAPARLLTAELSDADKQKIESPLKHIAELKDAKFVRNGAEYDAATAAKFLRGKWDANAKEIHSAAEFIEKAATSGQPYLIRFKEGKEVPSGEYLREQLKKLEASSPSDNAF